jgi:hypothetical protein
VEHAALVKDRHRSNYGEVQGSVNFVLRDVHYESPLAHIKEVRRAEGWYPRRWVGRFHPFKYRKTQGVSVVDGTGEAAMKGTWAACLIKEWRGHAELVYQRGSLQA